MTNYLMPFLIIICVGIIAVLIFNLWKALTEDSVKKAAYIHIVDGGVKMKTWGTEDFFNISTDALVMQGDEIITTADAKIIVEFFDGTVMRLDGNTDVNFVGIDEESDPAKIDLLLVDGRIWLNKLYRDTGSTDISVRTANLEVVSQSGSIFEVEDVGSEAVRVFSGNDSSVEANIYDANGEKVVEAEVIGVGQEVVFSDAVLEKYWQFQSPSVLSAIGDELKQTAFYIWNVAEDKAPTTFEKSVNGEQFVKVDPQAVTTPATPEEGVTPVDGAVVPVVGSDGSATVVPVNPEAVVPATTTVAPVAPSPVVVSQPTVTSVAKITTKDKDGYYVVSENPATLTGEVPGDVASVLVNGYVLKKFKAGDKTWTYYANASYGLMKEGANTYEVYSVDANGNKSAALVVKVMYKPVAAVPETAPATPVDPPATPPGQ
ncbi:MAG: FecR domain-containing protein [Candidatus Gracilibacteria bacterium]